MQKTTPTKPKYTPIPLEFKAPVRDVINRGFPFEVTVEEKEEHFYRDFSDLYECCIQDIDLLDNLEANYQEGKAKPIMNHEQTIKLFDDCAWFDAYFEYFFKDWMKEETLPKDAIPRPQWQLNDVELDAYSDFRHYRWFLFQVKHALNQIFKELVREANQKNRDKETH